MSGVCDLLPMQARPWLAKCQVLTAKCYLLDANCSGLNADC